MFTSTAPLPLFDNGRPPLTSVLGHETSPVPRTLSSCSTTPAPLHNAISFRHSGWALARDRILDAFLYTAQTETRIKRFDNCGSQTWVYQSRTHPDRYKLVGGYCRDRFCTPCSVTKSHLIRDNLMAQIQGRHIRHLVLTLVADHLALGPQIDNFYRCFALLRQTKLWRKYVTGGAAFLEVKWNEGSNRWHPHLHILFEGSYLPHEELKPLWYLITDGSSIVYLRDVPNDEAVARDAAKYAGKGVTNAAIRDPMRLRDAIYALAGRRVCATFGTWRKFRLLEQTKDDDWVPVASFDSILSRAAAKDPVAMDILRCITRSRDVDAYTQLLPGFQ